MILVIRFSALGDIAMTIPALYEACRSNPDEQFLMLTRKGPAKLFLNPPANLRVIGINTDDYKGASGLWKLASMLKQMGVDRVVDLHDVIRSRALSAMLALRGSSVHAIHKGRVAKKRLTRSYNKHIVPLKNSVERYRDTFRRAGLKMEIPFEGFFKEGAPTELFAAATPPRQPEERWIALAPFARHKGKIYPTDLMEVVISRLNEIPHAKIFLFAGGEEEERQAAEWGAKFPSVVNLAPLRLGFEAEMALMHECEVMLSMDSANMHLASLAGTRVVSVWGATHPFCGFMGWRQKDSDAVQLPLNCRPCSVFGNKPCERGDYLCLRGISPQRIIQTMALSLLMAVASILPASASLPPLSIPAGMPAPTEVRTLSPYNADYDAQLLTIANREFAEGNYSRALAIYADINPERLPLDSRKNYYLNYASSLSRRGLLQEAAALIEPLRKTPDGPGAANFLEGYLAYRNKDFDKARQCFEKASGDLLPELYLAQIDFQNGDWDKAFSSMPLYLFDRNFNPEKGTNANPEIYRELLRMFGLAEFKRGNYAEAAIPLEEYISLPGTASADATYALGAIYQYLGESEKATALLKEITDLNEDVSQGATFILGQIAADRGDNQGAALAFSNAGRINFDPVVGEHALYNYVVASTKGAGIPFASPAAIYEQYISDYGSGAHQQTLSKRFESEYFREKNFEKALEANNRIQPPTAESREARQKILYELGRRETLTGNYAAAIAHLKEGVAIKTSHKELTAESNLWLGDALYASGRFDEASKAYTSALGGLKGANRTLALYNDGYALFSAGKYSQARKRFEEAEKGSPRLAERQLNDARLRIADCNFYLRQYSAALKGYEAAAKPGNEGGDYAAMRRAEVIGLLSGPEKKIDALRSFTTQFAGSRWEPTVLLELGDTYSSIDRNREAAETYSLLERNFSNTPQARRGALARAMSLQRSGNPAEAAEAYRNVISRWPSSEEAALAHTDMTRLAAKTGTLDQYAAFLQSVAGAPRLNSDQMESLLFEAAESAYAENPAEVRRLEEYVERYPDGRYLAAALADLAESARLQNKPLKAIEYADRMLALRPDAPQAPEMLLLKGELIESDVPGRKEEALVAYSLLQEKGGIDFASEALAGIMRTADKASDRLDAARQLQKLDGVDSETLAEAELYEGLALLDSRNTSSQGEKILRKLGAHPETLYGARAVVELGEWLLAQGKKKEAQTLLEQFTDAGTPQAYWLARGFISLSDVYRAQGRTELADEYLRSLKANYPGTEPDIRNGIAKRLAK